MPFVQRNQDGRIVAIYATRQPGRAEELLADDNSEVTSFHNPPPSTDPADYLLTARQVRLGLVRNGVPLSTVQAAIYALPDDGTRDEAQIYWEFSTTIAWSHPMTQQLIALSGISSQDAAVMWLAAKDYEA